MRFQKRKRPYQGLNERPFALNSGEIIVAVFCPCAGDLRKGGFKES